MQRDLLDVQESTPSTEDTISSASDGAGAIAYGYIDGMSLHQYERSPPVQSLDPSGQVVLWCNGSQLALCIGVRCANLANQALPYCSTACVLCRTAPAFINPGCWGCAACLAGAGACAGSCAYDWCTLGPRRPTATGMPPPYRSALCPPSQYACNCRIGSNNVSCQSSSRACDDYCAAFGGQR